MHRMLAHYYRQKKDGRTKIDASHAEVIKEAVEIGRRAATEMDLSVATAEEDIRQFRENVVFWKQDGWGILEVEQPFSKVLYERPDQDGKEGLRILWEGIIDL